MTPTETLETRPTDVNHADAAEVENDQNDQAKQDTRPAGESKQLTRTTASRRPPVFWSTAAAAALMIIGGFGPWATVLGALSVSGTNGDGWFLIIGGIAAGALLFTHASKPRSWKAILMTVIGLICAIVAVVDLADIHNVAGDSSGMVSAAWGIYISLLASLGLLAAAIYTIVKRPYDDQLETR